MKEKRSYETPVMEVVVLNVQGSLLAGSDRNATSVEQGTLDGFADDWD